MVVELVPALRLREHTLERERRERLMETRELMEWGMGDEKCSSRALVQLPVFQETIFKGETLLLALAPFLKVEINVGALQKKGIMLKKCDLIVNLSVSLRLLSKSKSTKEFETHFRRKRHFVISLSWNITKKVLTS